MPCVLLVIHMPHNAHNNERQWSKKQEIVVGQPRHIKDNHEQYPHIDQGQAYPCRASLQKVNYMEQVFLHDGYKINKKRRARVCFLC